MLLFLACCSNTSAHRSGDIIHELSSSFFDTSLPNGMGNIVVVVVGSWSFRVGKQIREHIIKALVACCECHGFVDVGSARGGLMKRLGCFGLPRSVVRVGAEPRCQRHGLRCALVEGRCVSRRGGPGCCRSLGLTSLRA